MSVAPATEGPPRTTADAPATAEGRRLQIVNSLFELRAFIALIAIVIVFGVLSDAYLTWDNLVTMTKHVAINAILAIGMLMVVLTGGIDLSVGSIVGLAGIIAGVLLEGLHLGFANTIVYLPVWGVILVSLLVGTGVGAVNGALVTRFNVAPFIATLGTLYMARGVALLISNGETYPNLGGSEELGNTGFDFLGSGRILGIPTAIWLMVLFAAAAVFLTRATPFGRWVYAIGGNGRAAELAGVPVRRVTSRVYMISGACAAMAGLIIASELTSAAPQAGNTFELNAIAAVVIGGTSLAGGRGNGRGAPVGAVVLGFFGGRAGVPRGSAFLPTRVKGAVIVLAVILDQAQQKVQRRGAAIAAAAATHRVPATA